MADASTVEHAVRQYQLGTRRPFGVLEWAAMIRLLDHRDPSWRDEAPTAASGHGRPGTFIAGCGPRTPEEPH